MAHGDKTTCPACPRSGACRSIHAAHLHATRHAGCARRGWSVEAAPLHAHSPTPTAVELEPATSPIAACHGGWVPSWACHLLRRRVAPSWPAPWYIARHWLLLGHAVVDSPWSSLHAQTRVLVAMSTIGAASAQRPPSGHLARSRGSSIPAIKPSCSLQRWHIMCARHSA